MIGRVLRTGLSSLRDRAANLRRRLAALRFNPSRWWRSFSRRHEYLLAYAVFVAPVVALDRLTQFHSLAFFLSLIIAITFVDGMEPKRR